MFGVEEVICLVGEGTGEILEKDGEYLLRIPKDVFEDSNFPFCVGEDVEVSFEVKDAKLVEYKLVVKRIDP